jgi:hypothetical protein
MAVIGDETYAELGGPENEVGGDDENGNESGFDFKTRGKHSTTSEQS